MIVISHYTVHNGVLNDVLPIGFNRFFLEISTLGNIGTIIFVLITGFYLSRSENGLKLTKLFQLYLQVLFYSVSIYLIFVLFQLEPLSMKSLIKAILPISFEEYWFASVYILLYIFHPYINQLLNHLNRQAHFKLILTGLIIFSVFSTITTRGYFGNELIQFILFYSIGAYLGKYRDNLFHHQKLNGIVFVVTSCMLMLSVVFFDLLGTKISFFNHNSIYLFSRTSIVSILFAISLFHIFVNQKEKHSIPINIISSCVFGVYLISDNHYVRGVLWSDIFHNANYVQSVLLVPHMIISVVIIFVVCTIIEYFRKSILDSFYEKYLFNYVDRLQLKLEVFCTSFYDRINEVKE